MIDFTTVSREFRSLVDRRRDLQTFLGSGFAAMSVFLGNVLEGKMPPTLRSVQEHVFAFYALVLLVLSLILSLRLARLHGGMVLNGVLYARLIQASGGHGDPRRAARHNLLGVSFLQFVLVDLIAGFSMAVLMLSLDQKPLAAAGAARRSSPCGCCSTSGSTGGRPGSRWRRRKRRRPARSRRPAGASTSSCR